MRTAAQAAWFKARRSQRFPLRVLAVLRLPALSLLPGHDPHARYYGVQLSEKTLLPGDGAQLGQTRFKTWLSQPAAQVPSAHPQSTGAAVMTKEKETRKKAS